jgi:hypothetical protein
MEYFATCAMGWKGISWVKYLKVNIMEFFYYYNLNINIVIVVQALWKVQDVI